MEASNQEPAARRRAGARGFKDSRVTTDNLWYTVRMSQNVKGSLTSLSILAGCTLISLPFRSTLVLTDFAMLYLLGIIGVSVWCSQPIAIIHSVLSVAAFHFFFVPHLDSFYLSSSSYALTLAAMLMVALVISTLTLRIREQTTMAMRSDLATQTERMRSALLSAVSHDLRTPLASIYGGATTLLDQGSRLDQEVRAELIEGIADEALRLDRLVSNLLQITRLDAGIQLNADWHPLEEVVGSAIGRLRTSLRGRSVKVHIPPDVPLVLIDDVLVQQLFINLIENAVKYTPPGTAIAISAQQSGDHVSIEVSDDGPGFEPETVDRLFEKFYRGRTNGGRGVGLGLAICRSIVTAHHGTITASNRAQGGAVVSIQLPVGGTPPDIGVDEP